MERYYDFEQLSRAAAAAVAAVADGAGLEAHHPLVACAILEAISSPLKNMKLNGTPLTTNVGRPGIEAYLASVRARKVEELKSPHSLTVNGVMDDIVASLAIGQTPQVTHQEAFVSAVAYLKEGGVIEETPDGFLRLIE